MTPTPPGRAGDANCDGNISSIDAAFILQFEAGLIPELPCRDAADANQDGEINSVDATLIFQYIAGIIDTL